MSPLRLLLTLFFTTLSFLALPAYGVLRYIDDGLGDLVTGAMPVYRPDGAWKVGVPCETCVVNPDPDSVFNRTWHESQSNDTESSRGIELTFNGTSIEVFVVLSSNSDVNRTLTTTNLSFTLDGQFVWAFYHEASAFDPLTLYNISAFYREGLPHRKHTVLIEALGASAAFFDYATYEAGSDPAPVKSTTSVSSSSAPATTFIAHSTSLPAPTQNSHKTTIAPIVGGVMGGVALILAVFLGICARRRQLAQRRAWAARAGPPIVEMQPDWEDKGYSAGTVPMKYEDEHIASSSTLASSETAHHALHANGDTYSPPLPTSDVSSPSPARPHRPPALTLGRNSPPPQSAPQLATDDRRASLTSEHTLETFSQPIAVTGRHGPQPFRATPLVLPTKITLTPPAEAAHDGIMREKQAERLEELARERERAILAAHGSPPGLEDERSSPPSSGAVNAERGHDRGEEDEGGLRGRVEQLQAEMERMRAVQHGLVQEMGGVAPPPVYSETTGY